MARIYPLILTEGEAGFLAGLLFAFADPRDARVEVSRQGHEIAVGLIDKMRPITEAIFEARSKA